MTGHEVEFFLDLERKVWLALVTGDREADVAALSEDFLGVYPSGLSGRAAHGDQLLDGPTIAAYEIDSAQIRVVTDDDVLLTYRADVERPDTTTASWWISSLWSRRDGEWTNVFSQDTVADPKE